MIEFRILEKKYANDSIKFIPQIKGHLISFPMGLSFDTEFKDLYEDFCYGTYEEAETTIKEYIERNIPTQIINHELVNYKFSDYVYPDKITEVVYTPSTQKIKKKK